VAKEHRITSACVSNLVKASRSSPAFLRQLSDQKAILEEEKEAISSHIVGMYHDNEYLRSVKYIKAKLSQDHDMEIKETKLL